MAENVCMTCIFCFLQHSNFKSTVFSSLIFLTFSLCCLRSVKKVGQCQRDWVHVKSFGHVVNCSQRSMLQMRFVGMFSVLPKNLFHPKTYVCLLCMCISNHINEPPPMLVILYAHTQNSFSENRGKKYDCMPYVSVHMALDLFCEV